MNKIAIAVHGGAGDDSVFIQQNKAGYETGLREALLKGNEILKKGGTALDAVTAAVTCLEDNPLFNAGRGSALTRSGDVEMDASIMDGKTLKAGAVAMVRGAKNPVTLARAVMEKTNHVLLAGYGALEFAKSINLTLEEEAYFITPYRMEELQESRQETEQQLLKKSKKGTVGAVALDQMENLASATSTGGTSGSLPGRIGDSCIIGAGCYAANKTCAISGTGDGEFLITGVIAHSIAVFMELKQLSLQEACDYVIHERNKHTKASIGVIGVTPMGDIGISFNSSRMHRAWMNQSGIVNVKIYP